MSLFCIICTKYLPNPPSNNHSLQLGPPSDKPPSKTIINKPPMRLIRGIAVGERYGTMSPNISMYF